MTSIRTMYQLQLVEVELAEKRKRLQAVRMRLEGDPRLAELQAAADATRGLREGAESRLRELDLNLGALSEKLGSVQGRLFAGKVTNPKELTALEAEVASLKRRKSDLEDQTVAAMMDAEERSAAEGRALDSLRVATESRSDEMRVLDEERAELEERLQVLDLRRGRHRDSLAAADLSLYEDLSRRRGGRPIASVTKTSACYACGVAVPKGVSDRARAAESWVHCGSCERLLIVE